MTEQSEDQTGTRADQPEVVVVEPEAIGADTPEEKGPTDPTSLVEEPAKVMRIGTMLKQLLEEVKAAPLDDAARERLAEVHERSLHELEDGLSPELIAELHRITLPFTDASTPSDAELRVAQAQLVGWLEGLFHGIQTALVAQQMQAQSQLTQMRRALPPGVMPVPGHGAGGQVPVARADDGDRAPGQYL
ncbi:conserved hypothetical protein [Beutenbergia cavernae DSM 12333]|uniref:Bacterial proteasome activator n=1 Tax=Beutenbergia cavernae (strain ATCC BAA-8 / DSM 12333 / CCUG 43141 / JCM 11478 / NBRC 16432 / NCIMB 13614 / HKI 0122) TaxID=471853 RepID=C5BWJ0_BEUC1|nr:bacterial proteasome activator family protein [Beutenbergia cavernae]ACQ78648.1 conserved hypothetical protein [Beutenbergia cavernae DSM 12333]